MNRDLVTEFLGRQCGFPTQGKQIADDAYVFPTADWVRVVFAPSLRKLLIELAMITFAAEENDCDDFARLASVYASVLHRQTSSRAKESGLAFGEFWYVQDSGGGHAINFAIVAATGVGPQAGEATLLFFEPQTQKIKTLSETEVKSCTAIRL